MENEREPLEEGLPDDDDFAFEPANGGMRPEPRLAEFVRNMTATMEAKRQLQELLPPQPASVAALGLSRAFLTDLVLKIIHYSGSPSTAQLVRRVGLSPAVVQQLVGALSQDRLLEVLSQSDLYTGNYRYRLSDRGRERVQEALERTRYAGPAPVPVDQYAEVVRQQSRQTDLTAQSSVQESLSDLVLAPEVADAVARALCSGRSVLFFGPSGNGKSSILERFARHVGGTVATPYAIYAHGQVIRVFDPSIHVPVEEAEERNAMKDEYKCDRRWVLVRRPAMILGAELGTESLDLAYDPISRFYQAPPHIKAQGGVLVVDDFGRQKVDARELLARWLIPLERGWDTLSLATGEKVKVPFDVQTLFATSLPMEGLSDDALLRRILYKVEIPNPSREEFAETLRRFCEAHEVQVADGAVGHVVETLFGQPASAPRAAYAGNIVQIIIESARFDGRQPVLDAQSFEQAFRLFMVEQGQGVPAAQGY
ncbi:MAG: hypothetical protein HYS09_10500 [Chloroflexi bacterium]|nr:hypothetical protein [Chloroflexota bacterium]